MPVFFRVGTEVLRPPLGSAANLPWPCWCSPFLLPVFDSIRHSSFKDTSAMALNPKIADELDPIQTVKSLSLSKKQSKRTQQELAGAGHTERNQIYHKRQKASNIKVTCKLLMLVFFVADPEFACNPLPGMALALGDCSLVSLMRHNFEFLTFLGDFALSAIAFEFLVSRNSLCFGVNDTMILLPKTSSFSIRFWARSALSWFMKRRIALQPEILSTLPPQLSDRRLSLLLMLLPSLFAGRL